MNQKPTNKNQQIKTNNTIQENNTKQLHINLYLEDAFTPINDVRIRLIPDNIIDTKKPQDNINEQVSIDGKVSFSFPNNSNVFDLEVIDNRFYRKAKGNTTRVLNNYYQGNDIVNIHLLAKIWLYFNGNRIFIFSGNKIVKSFVAYSGKVLTLQEKDELKNNKGYKFFASFRNTHSDIVYFCLDRKWQTQSNKGTLPEGKYYININDISHMTQDKLGQKIYTDKNCTNTIESSTQRGGFYICESNTYSDVNGINVISYFRFFTTMESLKNHLINSNIECKENPLVIEFVVDYGKLGMNINSIGLARVIHTQPHIEQHKVVLTANYTRDEYISDEAFNAQKIQTYWGYKEILQGDEFDFDEVRLSEITHFIKNEEIYMGENLEIDLMQYDWHNYRKQIIVFAYLPTNTQTNNSYEPVINQPKWRIITWHNPIKNPRLTIFSFFGCNDRIHSAVFGNFKERNNAHQGLDLFANNGTPVYAPLDCEVADTSTYGSYGNSITLKVSGQSLEILRIRKESINYQFAYKDKGETGGNYFDEEAQDYYLLYAHLSKINVVKGSKVIAGQKIGLSGITGNATGTKAPHLHFEIRDRLEVGKKLANRTNPAYYLEFKKKLDEYNDDEQLEQKKACGQDCTLPTIQRI